MFFSFLSEVWIVGFVAQRSSHLWEESPKSKELSTAGLNLFVPEASESTNSNSLLFPIIVIPETEL